ncbi:Orf22 [Lactococcus phage bIL312]|nr:Orf22 [Lactococcus phage bIL312]
MISAIIITLMLVIIKYTCCTSPAFFSGLFLCNQYDTPAHIKAATKT